MEKIALVFPDEVFPFDDFSSAKVAMLASFPQLEFVYKETKDKDTYYFYGINEAKSVFIAVPNNPSKLIFNGSGWMLDNGKELSCTFNVFELIEYVNENDIFISNPDNLMPEYRQQLNQFKNIEPR